MFLSHIHNFRAIAIIGIVAAHTLHAFEWSSHPYLFRLFDTLFNQSSVLFFFIAGFMFQYLSSRFEKYDYWKKKLKNVITPYLLLSIPAIFYYTVYAQQDNTWSGFYDLPVAEQVFFFLITGKQLAPFWFVPTIAMFYLAAPLLVRLQHHQYLFWLLPIFMVISMYLGRGGHLGPINKAIYLFPVYVYGIFVCLNHDHVVELCKKFRVPITLLVLALIAINTITPYYDQYIQFLLKITLCGFGLYLLDSVDNLIGTRLNYLGHISFGIFFIHAYVLPVLKISYLWMSGAESLPEGNIISYFILTSLVLLGCTAIIWLLQKILGKNSRMILGA